MKFGQFEMWKENRLLQLVQVQTTSVCNAKCIVCPYPYSWYKKNPNYMNDDLFEKILYGIKDYDSKFTGKFCPYLANEPFADKKIIARVEKIYRTLHRPYVEISSNMSLLDEEKIDELYEVWKRFGFWGKFTASHHGIDKTSFERIMGIPYERSLKNLIYFLQKFDNKLDRISIFNMSYSLDGKYVVEYPRRVLRYLNRIKEEHGIDGKNLILSFKVFHNRAGNVRLDGWNYNRIVRKIDKTHPFDCRRIHNCLHVISTGEVILCCMDYFRETVMGDLKKQTVREFFNSKEFQRWRGMVRGEIETPPDFICKRCMSPGG